MPLIINIQNDENDEYRVPGPEKTEAQAYYTDDKEDAIATAKIIHGKKIEIKIIKVEEFVEWA